MKLRTKLLALSLLTLLLPWSAWKLLQELEGFLRESQQNALLASARTMATAIPMEFSSRLLFLPENYVPVWVLQGQPALDGYHDDWPGAGQGQVFVSGDGDLSVQVLAGNHGGQLFVLFDVQDGGRDRAAANDQSPGAPLDSIILSARSPRGLFSFTISPEAPGPLQLHSDRENSGQIEGYWLEKEDGYRVELALPSSVKNTDISFQVQRKSLVSGEAIQIAGPLTDFDQPAWVSLEGGWPGMSQWLDRSEIESARTWLIDRDALVLADSRLDPASGNSQGTLRTTWLQRLLYRLVAGSHTALLESWPEVPVRLEGDAINRALAGEEAINWAQDLDTAVVWNTVAVPVVLQGETHGAVVVQSTSDGLLLVTNRALGRLLFTTLAITFGLAAGLWYFATHLSRRVRKLSGAVSQAMQDSDKPGTLPLGDDRDELGELARNNQKLLRAVADYNQYLETLASKLSHELKTPLAITQSSLENLSSKSLDDESRQFLERAQEGVDRQFAIVRAMSEASRLEASIAAAEWETIDVCKLVRNCVDAYRSVHAGRTLLTSLPQGDAFLKCAPDLLAQALDKLVDNAVSLSGDNDEVTVGLSRNETHYELFVCNTGSHLPGELQERLFDSLVSLRDRPGAVPHLGLGLYIVRLVAEVHNGQVSARNLPDNRGVEFLISIPV
jgi:two-component system sensor histidine kinase ChvG